MNRLPDELLNYIFNHLDIADLFNLRLVSKRFRFFSSLEKIRAIKLEDKFLSINYIDKRINDRNAIKIESRSLMSVLDRIPFDLSKLRALCLHMIFDCNKFDLDFFEFFKYLEVLEVYKIICSRRRKLKLSKVKVLIVEEISIYIQIEAPLIERYVVHKYTK